MAQFNYDISIGSAQLGGDTLVMTQWSPEVIRYGKDQLVFTNFLNVKTELGKGRGDTIVVPIYGEMPTLGTTALSEGTSVPIGTQDTDSISVTVAEYGRGLTKPHTVDYVNNINNATELQRSLGWNWGKSLDALAKGVFDGAQFALWTIGTAGSYTFGSHKTELGVGTLTDDIIDYVYDKLKQAKAPAFPDGYYRWVTNNQGARQVKRLGTFNLIQIHNIMPMGIIAQEIGVYRGFRFIETVENMPTNPIGYAFGQGVGVQAFGMPVQIRYEANYKTDFGRVQGFAWLSIYGVAAALRDKGTHLVVVKTGTT